MTYSDELVDARIRALVDYPDNSNWADVRRRARRKWAPVTVPLALVAVALLAAPAVGLRSHLDALWATAEPEKNLYVSATVQCGEGPFTVEMDPKQGAAWVSQDSQKLARITTSEREIDCNGPITSDKSSAAEPSGPAWTGLDRERDFAATKLRCETDRPLEVEVHPIWSDDSKRPDGTIGSIFVVAERGTSHAFALANLFTDPDDGKNWSKLFWDPSVCSEAH
jgi:hypothetical protein